MSATKYIATITNTTYGEVYVGIFDSDEEAKHAVAVVLAQTLGDWTPAFGFSGTWNMEVRNQQCHVSAVQEYGDGEYNNAVQEYADRKYIGE